MACSQTCTSAVGALPARCMHTAAPDGVDLWMHAVEVCGGESGREASRGVARNAVIAVTVSAATTTAIASATANGLPCFAASRRGANLLGASNTIGPRYFAARLRTRGRPNCLPLRAYSRRCGCRSVAAEPADRLVTIDGPRSDRKGFSWSDHPRGLL